MVFTYTIGLNVLECWIWDINENNLTKEEVAESFLDDNAFIRS
jgi:hypothetical protein